MSNLQSYLDQLIEQDILDKHDLYSRDHMTPNQFEWEREEYYRTLWKLLKERMDNE